MPWLNVVLLLYGVLDVTMGFLGYASKHSVVSLIAGAISGILILSSIAVAKYNPRAGRIMALVLAVLMMGNFAKGTFVDNHLYPAGIMFVASLGVAICLGAGHMMGMKTKREREAAGSNVPR